MAFQTFPCVDQGLTRNDLGELKIDAAEGAD